MKTKSINMFCVECHNNALHLLSLANLQEWRLIAAMDDFVMMECRLLYCL